MAPPLKLISHKLCPYVQRAVIALSEKGVAFERVDIDLSNKPDWFLAISPLGKTPVLLVGEVPIFESAVILEYLEETQPKPLHPADPLRRAEHRGWIEFGSIVLAEIAGFYAAPDEATFNAKTSQLEQRFARLEARVAAAPWFDGEDFSLVDAVYGPVFRYFDVFDDTADLGILAGKPKLARWRKALAARPSVSTAVSADYPALLRDFIRRRNSWLSTLQARAAA
ncbi:glutathione S-transferase family protein [Bradyrhizobium sp.]|uniref:glutathione S-transferase family protein n=1 Tax=Bradyrhizobium sp. TaxID=376 RepID=UPI0025B95CC2|nr:glutathione S-transferase family protein [Bradyrhizobium sp.]